MDSEDREKLKVALAALFVAAGIVHNGKPGSVQEALAAADALIDQVKL
jgi:hypothetical protein